MVVNSAQLAFCGLDPAVQEHSDPRAHLPRSDRSRHLVHAPMKLRSGAEAAPSTPKRARRDSSTVLSWVTGSSEANKDANAGAAAI